MVSTSALAVQLGSTPILISVAPINLKVGKFSHQYADYLTVLQILIISYMGNIVRITPNWLRNRISGNVKFRNHLGQKALYTGTK